MALFEWGPKFELGVAQIDREHHRLVDLINTLHDAMAQGRSKAILAGVLTNLVEYTHLHFRNEEAIYQSAGFPDSVEHRKKHAEFAGKASELKAKFDSGSTHITMETMTFLKTWLAEHILHSDRVGCDFLRQRGVA